MSATPRVYKTSAIVLRGRAYGEADRILTLFTTERGKVDAIAKGIRRTKSTMGGRLEFSNEVQLTMHRGRNLDVVSSAEIERANWLGIVQPERYAAANVVIELVDGFSEPDLPLPDVYDLLSRVLAAIARSDEPLGLLPRFSLRLLDALGLAPATDVCARCGALLDGRDAWLDLQQSGFACEKCMPAWHHGTHLDRDDMENIRALAAPAGGTVKASHRATRAAAQAVEALVNEHLGRRPKAGGHVLQFVQTPT